MINLRKTLQGGLMDQFIKIENVTKDYGHGKGIFDVDISVKQGEVFGFLGPNGAGKTTTIRNLMGFIKPNKGQCTIQNMDCYKDAAKIQKHLGYLAGEIAFLDDLSGKQLMDFIASMKGVEDKNRMHELMELFELNPAGKIKKMSKGMKQKIGIICAFMNNPDILILDEPTSGLDPLMQNRFIDLLLEEKKKKKTIFMSSHIFEEIERTCDRTAIIKDGKIVAIEDMGTFRQKRSKSYTVTFQSTDIAETFMKEGFPILKHHNTQVVVAVKGDVLPFLKAITKYNITDLDIKVQTLEEMFLHFYGGEK
jgi:ABC-2 type transport system ATP-binding protein